VELTYWFGGWDAIARIALVAACGYVAMLVLLRVGGRRRLTEMRLFDFILAVTIGSAFGRALTAREVGVVDTAFTFAVLIMLQQIGAWLQYRVPIAARLMGRSPVLLYYRGQLQKEALAQERIREAEVLQAVRAQGLGSLQDVEVAVLEPDGTVSVIRRDALGDGAAVRIITDDEEP
jgi:uncharacterized membrane protein YcaP (DUF421 family)